MAKLQIIQKSRKEYKCRKCGNIIPVGSKYYKCEINFGPTLICCDKCKLESWECTTSEWQLSVGELVHRWEDNYGLSEDTPEAIRDEVDSIMSEQQDRLDNMPESLQYGDTGCMIQERIDACDAAISELDSIDIDDLKSSALEQFIEDDDADAEKYEGMDYDEVFDKLTDSDADSANQLATLFHDRLSDAIVEALNNLEV